MEVETIGKKFFGVARVSTQKQMRSGNSVEDQILSIQKYAHENKGDLVNIVKVQASGKKQLLNAGQLAETIKKAKEIGAELIVTKLDRLSRDQITLLMLKKASTESGVEIHITSMNRKISEISDLEFTLLSSIAQEERKMIVSRTKEASKNRIGPIGISLNAKELAYRSIDKRRGLADSWAKSVNLRSRIIDAVNQLKNPNLNNVALWLNGQQSYSRTGVPWNQVNLRQTMKRLGWKWSELKAG